MSSFLGRDILSTRNLTRTEIEHILEVARWMLGVVDRKTGLKLLEGKILASLFYQASTRTRLSFEAAMQRLGGSVIGFASAESSRASGPRAETIEDTIKTVEQYCNVIVIRHPESGAVQRAADAASLPVLSGGDGTNHHPSQGLLDTYTIWQEKGTLDGLRIGLLGDLRSTRGMHSLVYSLSNFNSHLAFIAPPELFFDASVKKDLGERKVEFEEFESIEDIISKLDVLYVTRLNKEGAGDAYQSLLKVYPRLTLETVKRAKPGLIVMHDLPRTDELGLQISAEIDSTPHAKYFEEVKYGVAVRMALIALTLGALE